MNEDVNRIAGGAIGLGRDLRHVLRRGWAGRQAGGVVGDAGARVTVPLAAAHLSVGGVDIGEDGPAVGVIFKAAGAGVRKGFDGDRIPFTVVGRGSERLTDLSVVETFAGRGQGRRQRDGIYLTDHRTGVACKAVDNRGGMMGAPDDRETHRERKQEKNNQTSEATRLFQEKQPH